MATVSKVDENRVRRAAERQGYILVKSRHRDPMAADFGRYRLYELDDDAPTLGADRKGESLDVIEAWLATPIGER
ncbi:MAG: hypothetical protein ABIQ73_13320 [Acidimicrobiales bacterium]